METAQPIRSDNEFRMVLRRLDDMVRRTGRITKAQLILVFDEICKLGAAKPNQALLLIRSCGSLLPEVALEERTALVSSIWDKLKELGTTFDVTHYNALLRVYLQNEHKFSPTDFLAQMEQHGIDPNRITYQRLISAYCLQGDIQGATKILEFMKSKDLPVTEGIFNSLITGHGRAGDLDNAQNILNVMRSVGLEPSADTYTALMCAYAEKGDIESINKLTQELESENVNLSGRCFLSVAYSLATYGHSEHLPQVLEKVQLNAGYIPDAINLSLSLMTKGHDDAAFIVLKMFQGLRVENSAEPQNQGNFFIDHAVQIQLPHETLFGHLDELISSGLHSSPYIVALHSALRKVKDNKDYAFGIIRRMLELDIPVRPHYFWPIFARDSAANDKEGIMNTLKQMGEMGVEASSDTFTRFVFPCLGGTLTDIKATINELGITVDKFLVIAMARNEVKQQRLDSVVQLIEEYRDFVDVPLIRAGLVSCFSKNPQPEQMVKICKHFVESHQDLEDNNVTKEDQLGSFLYDIVSSIPVNKATQLKPDLNLLLRSLAREGLFISGPRYRGIRNQLDRIKLPMLKSAALKLLDPTEIQKDRVANFDVLPGEEVSLEELENHLVELREKGGNLRGILRRLLLVHTTNNNFERSMELKKEFDEAGYEPTGAIFACLMNVCCNQGKWTEAMELKDQLLKFDPSFKLDISKYRHLICYLAKNNQLPDALSMVHEMKELAVETDRMEKQTFHMLNELASDGLTEEVERIFETMVELDLVKPNNNLVGPIVSAYMAKNDLEGALACIRDCQAKYSIMPHFQDVLVRLVEEGHTDQLQRAMDFASQQHGDINMLYDLIFAFCTSGKYKEAMKLVETPGMIAKNKRIQWYAERCIGANNMEALQQLTAITKDLYACDRDQMYFYLIQLHTRNNDVDKCLEVWTTMQEEGVVPRDRTMRYLANVLRSYDRPIPFDVPKLTAEQLDNQELNTTEKIDRILKAGNIEGAEELLKETLASGKDVGSGVFDRVIFEMLKLGRIDDALTVKDLGEKSCDFKMSIILTNKLLIEYIKKGDIENAERLLDQTLDSGEVPRPSGIRMLCERYEQDGLLDTLLTLKEKYEERTQSRFPIGKSVLGAYIVKGDVGGAVSYIEKELEEDPKRSRRIGMRSFFGKLLQKDQPLDEVYAMVDRLVAKDIEGPAWQLLYSHLDNGKTDGARDVIQRYDVIREKSSGLIGYAIEMVGSDSDVEEKIEQVLEITKDQDYLDRSKIYFYLLKAHDNQNNYQGGLMVKQKMEEEGLHMSDFMLKRLALLLTKTGQPIPFDEPPNPISFYREKLRLEGKDNLPEIKIVEDES
ncbi:leucine-rich PPR motif-containing protein, mitochondrial-like [Lytechinus pictus]|uniref:leucine-rich PPR motif-containing protein, mitochondrial-like n=1 Tax=Lytechinus pictus TaxID=7653 RepID=UPI0030B9E618